MALEDLRQKVLFHNSIDVWIEACAERGASWQDASEYGRFIRHLRDGGMPLNSFNLCAHEAGETQADKKEFAESLAGLKDANPDYATYTIRLSGGAIESIRAFR